MTETLNRPPRPSMPPRRPVAEPRDPERSALGLGAGAGVWAAAAGVLCVALPLLLFWAADGRSGTGWVEVLRSAGRFWLLAHGVTLDVPGGRFALTPIGLLALPVAILARFTASAARETAPFGWRAALALAAAAAAPYAVLVMLAALVCSGPDVHVSPVASLVGGSVVGLLGAGVGALRADALWRAGWQALSARVRRLLAAAALPTAGLLGAGALLVGVSLVGHFPRAAELAGAAEPGAAGGAALLLAGLALVPNAAIWGAGWLAGPGFAVGVGTSVGPFGHELGPVPALPLLAALPEGATPQWLAVLVVAVPVLGGWLAGRHLVGALVDDDLAAWRPVALEAALVGPLCGLALGLLTWLSGGAAGGERLVELGPSTSAVTLAVSASVGVGAVAGALLRRARRRGAC